MSDLDQAIDRVGQLADRLGTAIGRPVVDAALLAARADAVLHVAIGLGGAAIVGTIGILCIRAASSDKGADDRPGDGDWEIIALLLGFVFLAVAACFLCYGLNPVNLIGLFRPDGYLAHRLIFEGDGR